MSSMIIKKHPVVNMEILTQNCYSGT